MPANEENDISVPVKFGGALVRYKPSGSAAGNRLDIRLTGAKPTVGQLLEILKIPADARLMIIVNDTLVSRAEAHAKTLTSDDSVSLVPPIQAG